MKQNKSIELIGKNCKWNKEIKYRTMPSGGKRYCIVKKQHNCRLTKKLCGLKKTCDCFDDKGKLRFERKENNYE